MADKYKEEDAQKFAANYRNIMSDSNTGELAWRRILPPRSTAGVRDGDQYIEEGMYKNWEEADYFGSESTAAISGDVNRQPYQTLPEDHGNRATVIGLTPSASVYFRKKYFRTLAATAGWTQAFQKAVTNLMIQKSIDIATIEMLTKFRYMYGVREESDGALTRRQDNDEPVGKEYNHYRMYWYGDNVGNYPGGILEVTNFTQLSTSLTIDTAELGSCSVSIEDPYNLLYVSKRDIDRLFRNNIDVANDPAAIRRAELEQQLKGMQARQQQLQADIDRINGNVASQTPPTSPNISDAAAKEMSALDSDIASLKAQIAKNEAQINTLLNFPNVGQRDPLTGVIITQARVDRQQATIESLYAQNQNLQQQIAAKQELRDRDARTGVSQTDRQKMIDPLQQELAKADDTISQINDQLSTVPEVTLAQLKTGEYIYYKRDIDYLYHYVAGRSIFSVMDEVYIWMSPVKEDLFEFNVIDDLFDRLNTLYASRQNLADAVKAGDSANNTANSQLADCAKAAQDNQCKTQDDIQKEVANLTAQVMAARKQITAAQTKIDMYNQTLSDDSISEGRRKKIQETFLPQAQQALAAANSAYTQARQQRDAAAAQKPCEGGTNITVTPETSGQTTNCSPEQKATNQAAVDNYDGNRSRLDSMDDEMADIRARLSLFGYKFNPDGSLVSGSGPADPQNLRGFALTNGMQVFSGVVSGVSEAWNDGVYVVTINANNNFKFLDMSRLTPCGSMVDAFGLLDTPVTLVKGQNEKPEWHWLWGIRAMSGLNPASNNPTISSDGYSMTYLEALQSGMTLQERVYAGYDAGNLLSTIICGVPFDPNMQLAISIPDNDHAYYRSSISSLVATPIEGLQFIQQFRRIAEIQNRVLGNFVPFAWVPADILAYETNQFRDKALDQTSDPNSVAHADKPVAINPAIEAPFVTDVKQRKIIQDLLGLGAQSTMQISTVEQLSNYEQRLARAIDNLSSSTSETEQSREEKYNAYRAEYDIVDQKLKELIGNAIDKFYISDIISNYPTGDTNQDQNAAKCLTYRDAQNYILLNRREDIVRNIDQKYLVIDMTYLASITARAFVKNMRNGQESMWQTERLSQRQQVKEVADQLDWELFADTQGNIVYRKRQFNRIPSSVYKRRIVPYVSKFVQEVLGDKSLTEWLISGPPWNEREQQMVKYLPGIALSWVLVYQSAYLRAQLIEQDYPIDDYDDEERYAKELLNNTVEFYDASAASKQPRTRYHVYIMDEDIISWSFNENEGILCRVDVNGQWDYEKNGADPRSAVPTALTGAAVDYDMWFHYGYRKEQVTKAWLRDASQQIPTYALAYLAHAKAKILSGTVTVVGNPFYQPGEVVYIESRNMLYYVTKVAHSFSCGGDFRTTLTLEYGHYPGYWIADPYYLQSTMFGAGVKIYDKDTVKSFQENILKQQAQLSMDTLSGGFGQLNIDTSVSGQSGGGTVLLPAQMAGTNAQGINDMVKPPTFTATFDPVIVDRLRAARFFDESSESRGLNYDAIRRNDKTGE